MLHALPYFATTGPEIQFCQGPAKLEAARRLFPLSPAAVPVIHVEIGPITAFATTVKVPLAISSPVCTLLQVVLAVSPVAPQILPVAAIIRPSLEILAVATVVRTPLEVLSMSTIVWTALEILAWAAIIAPVKIRLVMTAWPPLVKIWMIAFRHTHFRPWAVRPVTGLGGGRAVESESESQGCRKGHN